MKYEVRLSSQTAADLNIIFEYISTELCEKETALNLINLLQKNILSLSEMPGRYRIYESEPWKSRNVHVMTVKSYLIFYAVDKECKIVNIIRIIYGSRDIGGIIY